MTAEQVQKALALIESASRVCFIAETVAHLQGRERHILPSTDQLRSDIKAMQDCILQRTSPSG